MESVTTHDGFSVTSSHEAADDMRVALAVPDEKSAASVVADVESAKKELAGDAGTVERTAGADVAKPALDKRTREGKKASIQSEIDELTGTKHHTQREVDAAKTELARLKDEMAALTQQRQQPREEPKPAAKAEPDELPTYAKMLETQPDLTPEQYLRQSYQFLRDQERREDSRRAAEASHMGRVKSLNDKIAAAEKLEPGFWESVKPFAVTLVPARELNGKPVTGGTAIADVILDSDAPEKLLRHFRDNIADLQRISTLHPVNAFREMGKLEARLEAASSTGPAPKAPLVSQANAPLKPVSASPTISDESVPEGELPVDEFFRRGNDRQRKRELAR